MVLNSDEQVPGRSRLLGVCAAMGVRSGIAPTLLRIATIVALVCAFKLTVVAYCAIAVVLRLEQR